MYIQQAYKGKNDWWRYLTTFFILIIAQVIGSIPIYVAASFNSISGNASESFQETLNPESLGLSQNTGLVFMMLPWVLTFFALLLSIRFIHEQKIVAIFSAYHKFNWKKFFFAFGAWALMLIVAEMVYYILNPQQYVFNYDPSTFFPLLFISFLLIPLQAGAEELYFRGNLMQGFGIWSRSRVFALVITSLIFGALHFTNPEVKQFGLGISMGYYIGFGLFMGILVIIDGGLEMPLAIHAINNIYGSAIVGYEGSVLQTPSLFKATQYNPAAMLILFLAAAIFYLLVAKQVFKWQSFNHLFTRVREPHSDILE